ncbi:MAG: NosD domain-containing protein [Candidatus Thorarchaeota archaeon]|jgi:hypothetical protein
MVKVDAQTSKPFTKSTIHAPIYIDSIDDFETLGFPGNGSVTDPYRISDLTITTSSGPAIAIWNVSVYYVISNCIVSGPVTIPHGLIALGGNGHGIIRDSDISNSAIGILLQTCINTIEINNNTFSGFSYASILSSYSNTTISDNRFIIDSYSSMGMLIDNSKYSILTNNDFNVLDSNVLAAVFLNATGRVEVTSCSFNGQLGATGILVHEYNVTEIIIQHSSFTQIGNEIGFGGYVENLLIDNCSFTRTGIGIGENTKGQINISRNIITDTSFGTYVESKAACIIENNIISNCDSAGVSLWSNYSWVRNNVISESLRGIAVRGHDNRITENIVRNNSIGVNLQGDMNQVYYNSFLENDEDAIDDGISNIWDDNVSKGNYWDTPSVNGTHPIAGSAGSIDRFPIYIEPTTSNPTTNTTDDFEIAQIIVPITVAFIMTVLVVSIVLIKSRPKE